MRVVLIVIVAVFSSPSAWATSQPKVMICNSKSEFVRIINAEGASKPAVDLWVAGSENLVAGAPSNFILRSFLENLVLGSGTVLYDLKRNNIDAKLVLRELDNPIGIAVRPGPSGCIQLFVGDVARNLSR